MFIILTIISSIVGILFLAAHEYHEQRVENQLMNTHESLQRQLTNHERKITKVIQEHPNHNHLQTPTI